VDIEGVFDVEKVSEDSAAAYWLAECHKLAAKKSTDRSTQLGAYLLSPVESLDDVEAPLYLSRGWNAISDRLKQTDHRFLRPDKYVYTEHAERRAIFNVSKTRRSTVGTIMFCPWYACPDCARAIIEAGIQSIYGHYEFFQHIIDHGEAAGAGDRWFDGLAVSAEMFAEAGVTNKYLSVSLNKYGLKPVLAAEKEFVNGP